jgi:hypothetical protein
VSKYKHSRKIRLWQKVVGLLVIVGVVFAILEVTNTIHLFRKTAGVVRAPTTPITNLPAKTANNSTANNKVPTSNTTIPQGTDNDKNGQVPSNVPTNSKEWSTSASGLITVKLPTANSTFQSGGTITGTASVTSVDYTLIDNQVGVISQGPINVINGNFTAAVNFKSYASTGRLDIFSTDSTGKEYNEVEIPINF